MNADYEKMLRQVLDIVNSHFSTLAMREQAIRMVYDCGHIDGRMEGVIEGAERMKQAVAAAVSTVSKTATPTKATS